MALDDRSRSRARNKTRNKAQELKGQVKEATGRASGDPRLEAEGRADQTKANLKQAVEKVKDALRPRR
ncbi:MAG TPA: CsbD family protein [Actinomycetota bacterium]|nr:CsbD family protein [Actinomycetota bacterium]